ncbi:MAG TPA: histidine kinase [Solirubrobacteraceae bacterium]|nr:histidine kinase [Solirubrobacteraceae bacterium]
MTSTPAVRPALHRVLSGLGLRPAWAIDALIVAAIVIGGLLHGPDATAGPYGWLWSVGLALPLLVRRRWPVVVFAVVAAIALVQWSTGDRAFGDAALLVALYAVAASQPLVITAIAAAVLEAGIALAVGRWASHAVLNAFIALSALATAAGAIGINARHRRALVASLHERAARLEHERDQHGRLSAAAERSRIAREMHDIVAHNLSVMIALADGATYAVHDDPHRAAAAMRTASRTGRQALTEMRRLLGVLREEPPGDSLAPQPGLIQIGDLVDQVRSAGLPVSYARSGSPDGDVPAGLELAAYRIVQEALTNTLKHAGAGAAAVVSLVWEPDRLCVEVRDTGRPSAGPSADGGGLRGMRERAAVYDGTLEAGPSPDGGWRVHTDLVLATVEVETPA